jgi:hypothetical protein
VHSGIVAFDVTLQVWLLADVVTYFLVTGGLHVCLVVADRVAIYRLIRYRCLRWSGVSMSLGLVV